MSESSRAPRPLFGRSIERLILPVVLTILLAAILLWHAAQFYPFFSDDALISLQYAKRLLAGHGLTWTDGVPVEGYSNLLWILLLALAGGLGADLIEAARLLGLMSLALVPVVVLWLSPDHRPIPLIIRSALLVFIPLNVTAATWAIGGLEMPLLSVLLCTTALLLVREFNLDRPRSVGMIAPASLLGLIAITRPDGFLFAVAFAIAVVLLSLFHGGKYDIRIFFYLIGVPLAFVLAQLLFRLWYYGDWLPNPAYVKIAFTIERWQHGWEYVVSALSAQRYFWVSVAVAFLTSLMTASKRPQAVFYGTPLVAWLLYVIAEGGDFFPSFRFMLPAIVLGTLIIIEAGLWINTVIPDGKRSALLVIGAILLFVIIYPRYYARQHASFDTQRAMTERWEWDGKILGELLNGAFQVQQPLIAVTAAGCVPYWSDLPAIDMFGLNDKKITQKRPTAFGTGFLGHELGDAAYVLGRDPDMIILNIGVKMVEYPIYTDTMKTPEFAFLYLPVSLQNSDRSDHTFVVWMRRESSRIGIQKWTDSLRIPGYYLQMDGIAASHDHASPAPAYLDKRHVLMQPIAMGQGLGYDLLIPDLSTARITIHGHRTENVRSSVKDGFLALEAIDGAATIESVVLEWRRDSTRRN